MIKGFFYLPLFDKGRVLSLCREKQEFHLCFGQKDPHKSSHVLKSKGRSQQLIHYAYLDDCGFRDVLTSGCINCCQSAILALAFRVWLKSTFSEVDVHVKGTVLLHFLKVNIFNSEFINSKMLSKNPPSRRACFSGLVSVNPSSLLHYPYMPSNPHLWDLHFFIVLIAAIPVLPRGPVSINQVPVIPEQGFCIVKVGKDLLLGHIHVKILQESWQNKRCPR